MSTNENNNAPQNGYVTVEEVLRYEYNIPTYQRGYRWEKEHVLKLLQDIYEDKLIYGKADTNWLRAINNKNDAIFKYNEYDEIIGAKQPYCIQPLVVSVVNDKFDVIDGQQRLTTISIIICALKTVYEEMYNVQTDTNPLNMPEIKLSYDSRVSRAYLENLWQGKGTRDDSKLDYRYMYQAYEVAKEFFNKELGQERCDITNYAELLKNILLKSTRFIWYCIDQHGTDPHEVFANFNTGKLELTNAELVKALFMDASNYDNVKNVKEIEDKRIVISEKWDEIETSLHNPDFWAFVPHPNQYEDGNYDTRIDVIFELFLLMHYVNHKGKKPEEYIAYRNLEKRDRYIFDEIEDWLKKELEKKPNDKNDVMQRCWSEIRKVFLGLQELYQIDSIGNSNNKIYNMAGLYINLANRIPGRVDEYVEDDETFLRVYYNLALVMQTARFEEESDNQKKCNRKTKLQELIKREVGFDHTETVEIAVKKLRHGYSDESNGSVNKGADKIVKTLLAYNIGLLNNTDGIGQRFDFRAFAKLKWQREHIFATNVDEAKNEKGGLNTDEERRAALKVLSESFELVEEEDSAGNKRAVYRNKYVEYVKMVYFHGAKFPPEFKYDEETVALDLSKEEQVNEFISKHTSVDKTSPSVMLAKALNTHKKSKENELYYVILDQIKDAKKHRDDGMERKLYYLILQQLKKDFYTREYVDIKEKVNGALSDYPEKPQYTIKVGEWSRNITTDPTRGKDNLVENLCDAYRDYVRDLYMENLAGSSRTEDFSVKKEADITDDMWRKLEEVFEICKETLERNIDEFFAKEFAELLKDNTMGNMTLLTGGNKSSEEEAENQNQKAGNKSFKLKKRMLREAFQKGEFVPLGTVLVFSDAYNDSANTANFWLPDSRLRYLENMVKTLKTFLE